MAGKGEKQQHYSIPENFIEGGRVLNGTFKIRNFVEAIIIGGIAALVALALPITSLQARISAVCSIALPPALLALIGINDDPLSTFILSAIRWKKQHRIMIYNDATQAYKVAPLDAMMSEDLPKDKLIGAYENWREQKEKEEAAKRANLVYEFEEDTELERIRRLTEKKDESPTEGKKRFFHKQSAKEKNEEPLILDEEIEPDFEQDGFIIGDAGAFIDLDTEGDSDEFII